MWIRKNGGSWENSGNPANGTNPSVTVSGYSELMPFVNGEAGGGLTANFGQDSSFAGGTTAQGNSDGNGKGDFYYTPPSGFLALCTNNLPAPTVKPKDNFNVILYAGNTSVDRDVTGVGFQPDFTWIHVRTANYDNQLYDAVRGGGKELRSDSTMAEIDRPNKLNSFLPDGFTLGDGTNQGVEVNQNGQTYVAWNWKANGTGSSNTSGTVSYTHLTLPTILLL